MFTKCTVDIHEIVSIPADVSVTRILHKADKIQKIWIFRINVNERRTEHRPNTGRVKYGIVRPTSVLTVKGTTISEVKGGSLQVLVVQHQLINHPKHGSATCITHTYCCCYSAPVRVYSRNHVVYGKSSVSITSLVDVLGLPHGTIVE